MSNIFNIDIFERFISINSLIFNLISVIYVYYTMFIVNVPIPGNELGANLMLICSLFLQPTVFRLWTRDIVVLDLSYSFGITHRKAYIKLFLHLVLTSNSFFLVWFAWYQVVSVYSISIYCRHVSYCRTVVRRICQQVGSKIHLQKFYACKLYILLHNFVPAWTKLLCIVWLNNQQRRKMLKDICRIIKTVCLL